MTTYETLPSRKLMNKTNLLPATLVASLIILCGACGGNNTQPEQAAATTTPAAPETTPANPPIDARADSAATLNIPAGDSAVVMLGELKSLHQHMTVTVPVQDKRRLTATLMPLDSLHNIRFSQLIYPDGKMDGPFGRNIGIATPQNGPYQLLITHNLMAEGGLAKEFKLRIVLTQ